MNIDQMAADANQTVLHFIARSAGQHTRAMKASWPKPPVTRSTHAPQASEAGNVWFAGAEPDETMTTADRIAVAVLLLMSALASVGSLNWLYQTLFN